VGLCHRGSSGLKGLGPVEVAERVRGVWLAGFPSWGLVGHEDKPCPGFLGTLPVLALGATSVQEIWWGFFVLLLLF
jgi:hypothetical protein